VRWTSGDSLAACPAGDTVAVADPLHLHPSRLRIGVEYFDSGCNSRPGVPPDSIWVTWATGSGNVVVHDKSTQVFADDSTDGCGFARLTLPSLSGCGVLSVYLYVSGVFQGSRTITVRTTDSNVDGRTNGFDTPFACDLNYDGLIGSPETILIKRALRSLASERAPRDAGAPHELLRDLRSRDARRARGERGLLVAERPLPLAHAVHHPVRADPVQGVHRPLGPQGWQRPDAVLLRAVRGPRLPAELVAAE
jgi:hypothetical protein